MASTESLTTLAAELATADDLELLQGAADLQRYSRLTEADILPCARDLNRLNVNARDNRLQAVRKKYAKQEFRNVSALAPFQFP